MNVTLLVYASYVARPKPAVLIEGLFCSLLVAEVAYHHIRRFYEHFAFVAYLERYGGVRNAAGIGGYVLGGIAYCGNIGL